ncbi:MAG: hypothetical protein U0793_26325 [Gemmataceae bacterium]
MPTPEDPKPPQSRVMSISVLVCVVIGIVAFQILAPRFIPSPPEGGFNWERVLWAGLVGGVSALIGAGVGLIIEKMTRK